MAKTKGRIQFIYYTIPVDEYVMAKLGKGWEQEYGLGYGEMQHFHNYLEVGICYNGKGRLIIEDKTYRYEGGMISIIPANIPHTTISDPGNICKLEYLFIDMDEYIKAELKTSRIASDEAIRIVNKKGLFFKETDYPDISRVIHNIVEECRQEKPFYKDVLKGYLAALVFEIIRADGSRVTTDRTPNLNNQYIKIAVSYVKTHFSNEIKISEMASMCGLSESHFRKVFEECMNMKPNDYINSIRIMEACRLLKREDISMEELGLKVGYQTPSTFNRNFRKITGKTPYQWKTAECSNNTYLSDFYVSAEKGWEA
jgi:AraC-like DNA-binding protein